MGCSYKADRLGIHTDLLSSYFTFGFLLSPALENSVFLKSFSFVKMLHAYKIYVLIVYCLWSSGWVL